MLGKRISHLAELVDRRETLGAITICVGFWLLFFSILAAVSGLHYLIYGVAF